MANAAPASLPSRPVPNPAAGPEDSVDWDTTQNLMIEGDNLEVLKLLQKSYAGKIKLIYIDPPYNTGKDFVYPDNFQDSIRNYLELTKQTEGGRKASSNTEANGRFHTDWLSMIYPRLKLVRSLLRNDGAIFISIDDSEVGNLRAVCDEVFGQENFIVPIIWQKRITPENRRAFSFEHDYILCYARSGEAFVESRHLLPLTDEARARYKNLDRTIEVIGNRYQRSHRPGTALSPSSTNSTPQMGDYSILLQVLLALHRGPHERRSSRQPNLVRR